MCDGFPPSPNFFNRFPDGIWCRSLFVFTKVVTGMKLWSKSSINLSSVNLLAIIEAAAIEITLTISFWTIKTQFFFG